MQYSPCAADIQYFEQNNLDNLLAGRYTLGWG